MQEHGANEGTDLADQVQGLFREGYRVKKRYGESADRYHVVLPDGSTRDYAFWFDGPTGLGGLDALGFRQTDGVTDPLSVELTMSLLDGLAVACQGG